jgi:NAD(P)H-hydrate repair Nnr-like enzyme with NAD(P)H-hydrate dehydratase domain
LAFSKKHKVTILLKGPQTTITTADGKVFKNTTGNNGMATAGSGDVLTGIITSLCAQGYSPVEAACLGAYLHGFAGDVAATKLSKTSMIASDIAEGISEFFREFER